VNVFKVGDVVKVYADFDLDSESIDYNAPHVIKRIRLDGVIVIERRDGKRVNGNCVWIVTSDDIELWSEYLRGRLKSKMDEMTQLQREIAELERELDEC
jgi:hypothetical protein